MATVIYPSRAFSKLAIRPPSGLLDQRAALGTVEKATEFLWNHLSLFSLGAAFIAALPNSNTSFRYHF